MGSLSYDHILKGSQGMIGLCLKQICLFENNLVTVKHLMPFSLIALSFVRRFCPSTSSSLEHQKSWILGENTARPKVIKTCPRNNKMWIEVSRFIKRAPLSSDRVLVVVWFGKSIDQLINVVHSTRNTELSRRRLIRQVCDERNDLNKQNYCVLTMLNQCRWLSWLVKCRVRILVLESFVLLL